MDRAAQPGGPRRADCGGLGRAAARCAAAPFRRSMFARAGRDGAQAQADRVRDASLRDAAADDERAVEAERRHDRGPHETTLDAPARLRQAHARLRLHRLQAREPRAPGRASAWRRSASSATATTSTTSRCTREEFDAALQHAPDQRHRLLPRPARPGSTCATRSSRSCSRQRPPTSRSASGAPAARRARRPTPSRWCSPRRSATTAFRERVKIYATDVDEDALDQARHGALHGQASSRTCRATLLERYFERTDQRYAFRKDLRRTVIFGRNDLVQDAPISRIDLLVCRNTLMYFNAETQARILRRLPLRARRRRRPDAGQVGDADHARATCSRRSTSSGGSSARCRTPTMRDRVPRRWRRRPRAAARPGAADGAARRRVRASRPLAQIVSTARRARRSPTCRRARCSASRARTSAGRSSDLELVLPAGRAARAVEQALARAPAGRVGEVDVARADAATSAARRRGRAAARRRRTAARARASRSRTSPRSPAAGRAEAQPARARARPTRSCSRRSRSSRRPTRSSSRPTRSWRRPTRSSSRPTRSSRR